MALHASRTPFTCAAVDWLFMPLGITAMVLSFAAGRGVASGSCAVPYLAEALAIAAWASLTIAAVPVEFVGLEPLAEPLSWAHPASTPAMRRIVMTAPAPRRVRGDCSLGCMRLRLLVT